MIGSDLPLIRLVDTQFSHAPGGMGNGDLPIHPSYFRWHRGDSQVGDVVVITEQCFRVAPEQPEAIKVGFIVEPRCVSPWVYSTENKRWVAENFDFVYSHDIDFIASGGSSRCQFRYAPLGGTWIDPSNWKVLDKDAGVSIIVSSKAATVGHQLRHEIVRSLAGKHGVDVYGRGYRPIQDKREALSRYRYSIVIENEKSVGWFTEKLIDCFACGTVPLYWGDPNVSQSFLDIPVFDGIEGIDKLLAHPPKVLNHVIGHNLEAAKSYAITEDWLWLHGLMDLVQSRGD